MKKELHYRSKNQNLFQHLGTSDLLHLLLKQRGITDIETFLTLPHEVLNHASLFKNIEKAVDLFLYHLKKASPITILVDSDTDGFTSAAVMWRYLKDVLGVEAEYLIHSGKQHGITEEILEQVLASSCGLLICPDAATNDQEACLRLREAGVDVLILDHHEIEFENQAAVVINNQDKTYPNPSLSGVGVVYKFIQYFNQQLNLKVDMREYLALVALGMIADLSDLRQPETRLMVLEGLKLFEYNSFLKALCEKQAYSMNNKVTIESVAWSITPLINATIRMGSLEDKKDLFKAFIGHQETIQYTPRKSVKNPNPVPETQTFQQAVVRRCLNLKNKQSNEIKKGVECLIQKIEEEGLNRHKIIIVKADELKSTMTGLVANKLAERYKRPCLIMRHQHTEQSIMGGSGRNYAKCNLEDFKSFLEDSSLMEFIQGHANSFGCQLHQDKVEDLLLYANRVLADLEVEDVYHVDCIIPVGHLTESDVLKVAQWSDLWGCGLAEPIFAITDIYLLSDQIQLIGEKKNLIKFTVERGNQSLTFVKFFANERYFQELIHRQAQGFSNSKGKRLKLTVIGKFKANEWNNEQFPQIEIIEILSEEMEQSFYF